MKTQELLEKHPKVTKLIKEWWHKKVEEAVSSQELSDEYRDMILKAEVTDSKIVSTIDTNPHTLFEFFDENEVYIKTGVNEDPPLFGSALIEKELYYSFRKRIEAERDILDYAFPKLEEKL